MDAEIAAQDAVLVPRTDRAAARSMMSPGIVAHEFSQLIVGLILFARHFLRGDQPLFAQILGHRPDKMNSFHDSV